MRLKSSKKKPQFPVKLQEHAVIMVIGNQQMKLSSLNCPLRNSHSQFHLHLSDRKISWMSELTTSHLQEADKMII